VVQEEAEVDVINRVKLAAWSDDEEAGELLHLPLLLEPEPGQQQQQQVKAEGDESPGGRAAGAKRKAEAMGD
jgi:hypothetical protein